MTNTTIPALMLMGTIQVTHVPEHQSCFYDSDSKAVVGCNFNFSIMNQYAAGWCKSVDDPDQIIAFVLGVVTNAYPEEVGDVWRGLDEMFVGDERHARISLCNQLFGIRPNGGRM